jgi:hypothetical protein
MTRNKFWLTTSAAIAMCMAVVIPIKIASAQTAPVATCNGSQSLGTKVSVQFKNVGITPIRFGLLDYTCTFRAFPFAIAPNSTVTITNYPTTLYRVFEDVTKVLLNEYRLQARLRAQSLTSEELLALHRHRAMPARASHPSQPGSPILE